MPTDLAKAVRALFHLNLNSRRIEPETSQPGSKDLATPQEMGSLPQARVERNGVVYTASWKVEKAILTVSSLLMGSKSSPLAKNVTRPELLANTVLAEMIDEVIRGTRK